METITQLKNDGFFGMDVSLEISLFEYGLICKETSKDNYLFYYGIGIDYNGNYNLFDYCNYSKNDLMDLINESWVNLPDVLSFVGQTKKEWLELNHIFLIFDLGSYYGYENIFGSSYGGFEVSNE